MYDFMKKVLLFKNLIINNLKPKIWKLLLTWFYFPTNWFLCQRVFLLSFYCMHKCWVHHFCVTAIFHSNIFKFPKNAKEAVPFFSLSKVAYVQAHMHIFTLSKAVVKRVAPRQQVQSYFQFETTEALPWDKHSWHPVLHIQDYSSWVTHMSHR